MLVAARVDQRLHEPARLSGRPSAKDLVHWHRDDAQRHTTAPPLDLVQSDVRQRRVGEHAERDQTPARRARFAREVVPNDAKVVFGDVRELRASGALADGPYIGRAGLQPLVDCDVAARVELDPGDVEPDARRCWECDPSPPEGRSPRWRALHRPCARRRGARLAGRPRAASRCPTTPRSLRRQTAAAGPRRRRDPRGPGAAARARRR